MKNIMKKLFKIVILLLFMNQSYAFAHEGTKTGKVTGSINIGGALGTYANPPRFENGSVDFYRLISELKDIHADTYNWLIYQDPNAWNDLKKFLPLARKAKIKVWVTLVPPTESQPITKWSSEPFCMDYARWATELATLSLAEPNLVVWSIDDFVHNLKFYSPEYVEKLVSTTHAINPKLAFIPCCYFTKITPSFVTNYGHLLDGILFPYRAESVGANLQDATQVENEVAKLREMFSNPDFPIFLDIYASGHSRLGAATPEYMKDVLTAARRSADGVLIYLHQDPVKSPAKYTVIKEGFKGRKKYAANRSAMKHIDAKPGKNNASRVELERTDE